MYAVIKSGGKQYRVESGAQVRIESLVADVGARSHSRKCSSSARARA